MNNDYWDYIGGRDHLAQFDETGNYIAHYGVKGMTWDKHRYTKVNPDGTYEYGTLNTGNGSLKTQHFSDGSMQTGTVTRYTSNKKVGVNPNANRFGLSIKKDKAKVTDHVETQRWTKTGKNTYAGYPNKSNNSNKTTIKDDRYLQVNYNKAKVDDTKKKVSSTFSNLASQAKSLINSLKSSSPKSTQPSTIKDKVIPDTKTYDTQIKDNVIKDEIIPDTKIYDSKIYDKKIKDKKTYYRR